MKATKILKYQKFSLMDQNRQYYMYCIDNIGNIGQYYRVYCASDFLKSNTIYVIYVGMGRYLEP